MDMNRHLCGMCLVPLTELKVQFARRMEQMVVEEKEGKQLKSVKIFSDDVFMEFCNSKCWAAREPEVMAAYELKNTYPSFQWIATCSRCGATVNRTKPYVSLNLYKVVDESKSWGCFERVLDDKEFAVLCFDCDAPTGTDAEQVHHEIPKEEACSIC
ncbi:MAG: hypothetical protein KKH12_05425 [Gammaproteobacteria bacterium]|nr:hypothetical protein [Gammaproteobacteria bacterium]MBU1481100.1 hypothetical protein [Gammaproteobacteria bacterium]